MTMATEDITIKSNSCKLMKAYKSPQYGSHKILTDSQWEYVSLFLRRFTKKTDSKDALFYWEQAYSFYKASQTLPDDAKPLTSYYCILNASKALLRYQHVAEEDLSSHGVSSSIRQDKKISLDKCLVKLKGGGVLAELARYYSSSYRDGEYTVSELLYNVPCVHRAYCVTQNKREIFIPIYNPKMVKKSQSKEAWVSFEVSSMYTQKRYLKWFGNQYDLDKGQESQNVIRRKKRFKWDIHEEQKERIQKLVNYHNILRKRLYYIAGDKTLWYFKRDMGNNSLQEMPSTVLIFCIFHWLSELVRYKPKMFREYMDSKQNWLLHEFISNALDQFVDEISCEITGKDIMSTGVRGR